MRQIFVDTSALVASYIENDDFHAQAASFLSANSNESVHFVTTNFILDETYTYIRNDAGKEKALMFSEFINKDLLELDKVRVLAIDERVAWKYFSDLPGRGVSFTDSTSFAVMKRLGLKEAFTFDRDFRKAGFKVLP
ncbi:MAG: PIN domain-containing protein [Patescibacteria group bacterium]